MIKAFDSINRTTLLNDLKKILQNDELHLVKTLLDVELSGNVEHLLENISKLTQEPHKAIVPVQMNSHSIAKALENKTQYYEHDYAKIKSIEPNSST